MTTTDLLPDITLAMRTAGGLEETLATGAFPDLTIDTAETVVAEAARFADEVLAPLNRIGDQAGVVLANGKVRTAPGFPEAYRKWVAAGWGGIGGPSAWGGQAMPVTVQGAVQEIWNAANAALATAPMLTGGAVDALVAHADADLHARYLPQLVSGEWTATMNLTEAQAGSDLGAIKTRAVRADDGTYRIFGQKIFITWGEHDLADNILHLVLARLPDAAPGTKGISMFAVPKILPDGRRNDLTAAGIEEKLGTHGAPTCTMIYGERGEGAVAWRIGDENKGLAAMFTMMNLARLSVGLQGVGVAAAATERAIAYARERRQGRAIGAPSATMSPIIAHPDVQRMLLTMRTLTAAARAICYATAHAIDMSRVATQADRGWTDRAAFLTPIAKAFATDAAVEVANLAIQVHGGAGYIEETGVSQAFRDARVFAIYEGTNGIQAIDLVTRKLGLASGSTLARLVADVRAIAVRVAAVNEPAFGRTGERLAAAADHLEAAARYLLGAMAERRPADALAGASPFLRLSALTVGGALLSQAALAPGNGQSVRRLEARFFAETFLGDVATLAGIATSGGAPLAEAAETILGVG